MKKLFLLLTLVTCICLVSSAQTVDEIISKHIENTGGKDKLSSVTSVTLDLSMNIMGTDAPSHAVLLVGKGLRSEMDFSGQKVITVVTDKSAWTINPMAGINTPQAMDQQQYLESKDQMEFAPFINYQEKGFKMELIGKEKLNNEDVFKINFTNKDNVTTTCYFNANTYYLVKSVRKVHVMDQEMEVTTTYSDYRKTDFGVVIAYASKIDYGQFQLSSMLNKIEFNKQVDPAVFEMK